MATEPRMQPQGNEDASTDEGVPRMPHERDESSDEQGSEPREIIQQAHDDAVSGKADTSRSEATEETYRKNLREPRPRGTKP
jgi:hypothetical protein